MVAGAGEIAVENGIVNGQRQGVGLADEIATEQQAHADFTHAAAHSQGQAGGQRPGNAGQGDMPENLPSGFAERVGGFGQQARLLFQRRLHRFYHERQAGNRRGDQQCLEGKYQIEAPGFRQQCIDPALPTQ